MTLSPASLFTMVTEGEVYVLDVGDDITLQCEFHVDRFNLFYNPILWLKIQYHEATEMNIMGNMKPPFTSSNKYKVHFDPLPPKYTMGLTLTGKNFHITH